MSEKSAKKEYKPGKPRHFIGGAALAALISGAAYVGYAVGHNSDPISSGDRTAQTIDKHKSPDYRKAENEAMMNLYKKVDDVLDTNDAEISKAKKGDEANFKSLFILDGIRVETGEGDEQFTYPAFETVEVNGEPQNFVIAAVPGATAVRALPDDAKFIDIFSDQPLSIEEVAGRVKKTTVIRGDNNLPESFGAKGGPVMRSNQELPAVATQPTR